MDLLGPIVEIETDAPISADTGIQIGLRHFLHVPANQQIKMAVEGDKHIHSLVTISKKGNKYMISEPIDRFTEITSNYFLTDKFTHFCHAAVVSKLKTDEEWANHFENCSHIHDMSIFITRPKNSTCPIKKFKTKAWTLPYSEQPDNRMGDVELSATPKVTALERNFQYTLLVKPGEDKEHEIVGPEKSISFKNYCKHNGCMEIGAFKFEFLHPDCQESNTWIKLKPQSDDTTDSKAMELHGTDPLCVEDGLTLDIVPCKKCKIPLTTEDAPIQTMGSFGDHPNVQNLEHLYSVSERRQETGHVSFSGATINVGGNINVTQNNQTMNLNMNFLDLEDGQKTFLKEQGLTTLDGLPGKAKSILKIDTIIKSVCMMKIGTTIGTGFIAKIPNHGVAFMTAGHNFKDLSNAVDFSKFTLYFGNIDGNLNGTNAFHSCTLLDLDAGVLRGSIGLGGKRRDFPGNTLSTSSQYEDYCVLLFPEAKLQVTPGKQLAYLECGKGDYLKFKPDGVVSIFGHPCYDKKGDCREGPKHNVHIPLRNSYGNEISTPIRIKLLYGELCKKLFGQEPPKENSGNFLLYDNDTLPGSSGSPVIGRGDREGTYAVKGIHVREIADGRVNGAQSLQNMQNWLSQTHPPTSSAAGASTSSSVSASTSSAASASAVPSVP